MAPLEEAPSELSSMSSNGMGEKVSLRLCFGGQWEKQMDGKMKYMHGETYLEKVPGTLKYAELMHRLSEKVNRAVILKYTPPGEDVDPNNLVTCVDDEHVQEMFEEYFAASKANDTPGKTFRLQVWLSQAREDELTPKDFRGMRGDMSTPSTSRIFDGSSSLGSNNSNASAGTRSPHVHIQRRSGNTASTVPRLSEAEDQMRYAQEEVEWMNDNEQDDGLNYQQEHQDYTEEPEALDSRNWQALMLNNLSRAHDCTFDSSGWPHDRSPFLKAAHKKWRQQHTTNISKDNLDMKADNENGGAFGKTPRVDLTSRLPYTLDMRSASPCPNDARPESPYLNSNTAQNAFGQATNAHVPSAPLSSPCKQNQGNKAANHVLLPSKLGSDFGDGATYDLPLEIAEKALQDLPMEEPRALNQGPFPGYNGIKPGYNDSLHFSDPMTPVYGAGFNTPLAGNDISPSDTLFGLVRTPSRMAITQESVFKVPRPKIQILQVIGEGTFGEVHLARNEMFGKVAVKWLKPAKMDKHKAKFWEEAKMLAALNHPNVLRFYGVVIQEESDPTVVGIMTEYMNGSSLSNYLRSGAGRLSLLQRAELARGAVNGLAYLHEMNIVHFDLKPDNLLLEYVPQPGYNTPGVKVADFGLSKQKYNKYVSGVRDLRGTLPYMAPELVSDPDHVSESADIWSLGMVFWEMLTMETPYQMLSPQQIIQGLMMGQLRPEIPADCESEWLQILEACLQTNPNDRCPLSCLGTLLDRIIDSHTMPYY